MRSRFDILCEEILTQNLLLEMPLKRAKNPEDYVHDPSHGTYSVEVEIGDPEVRKQVLQVAVKHILDDLKSYPEETFSGSPKDYQEKVAEMLRKAINDVVPTSKKPSRGKPYLTQDYYAARAISKALRDQGIIDEIKDTGATPKAVTKAVNDITDQPDVASKVDSAIETKTDTVKPAEAPEAEKLNIFNPKQIYGLNDSYNKEDFTSKENRAIEHIESDTSGEKIIKALKNTLVFRDTPELIRPFIEKLLSKGVLTPSESTDTDEESNVSGIKHRDGATPDDIAKELRWEIPQKDPYTGA